MAKNKLRKDEQRLLDVLRDKHALLEGWKCPVCRNAFKDQYACKHGWADVAAANDRFLIDRLSRHAT